MSRSGNPGGKGWRRVLALTLSAAAHVAILAALLWPSAVSSPPVKPALVMVNVAAAPKPPGAMGLNIGFNPVQPMLPRVTAPDVEITSPPDTSDLLSEAQLAGAASPGGGGGGGGGCEMARLVQQALRRDPMVHSAVARADRAGKAVLLWNGDWVQSGAEDGKGLSVVREAILWEVGFAPAACRNTPMHGLVVLSLADGGTRFAIGSGSWRWSDLLGLRGR
jgi:hypothetical protein